MFHRQTKEEIIAKQQAAVLEQSHLAAQTLDNFEVSRVTPLNPEIISRQATINIGTIGHVAHGKSTLVRSVSGTNVSLITKKKACLTYSMNVRLCVFSARNFVTLQSSSATPTPSSTNVALVSLPTVSSLSTPRSQTILTVSHVKPLLSSSATSPSSIAQVTMP